MDHLSLLYKLQNTGIHVGSYVYDFIKDMYVTIGTKLCVKSGSKLSRNFPPQVGISKGDVLIYALHFLTYISMICKIIQEQTPILHF